MIIERSKVVMTQDRVAFWEIKAYIGHRGKATIAEPYARFAKTERRKGEKRTEEKRKQICQGKEFNEDMELRKKMGTNKNRNVNLGKLICIQVDHVSRVVRVHC